MPSGPGLAGIPSQALSKPRFSHNATALILLAALASLIVSLRTPLADYAHCWDFNEFYIAGQMIRHGAAKQLYDFSQQAAFQVKYVGPTAIAGMPEEPFLYPAATALPYLPLAWLSLKAAYAVWLAVNSLLLLVSVRLLQREFAIPQGNWPLVLALLAAPVLIGLVGGQVIFLVLLLYVLALRAMRRRQWWLAGLFLGLVGLKFQLMVGVAVILFARAVVSSLRDSRLGETSTPRTGGMLISDASPRDYWTSIAGIASGGVIVAVVSALIVGWRQMLAYPEFIRNATYTRHVAFPTFMVNLRGLLALFTGDEPRVWIVAVLSAIVLIAAVWAWRDTETGFALAIIATLLTAFHEYPQELCLLLIPLALAAERVKWTRSHAAAVFVVVPAVTCGLFAAGAQGLMGVTCATVLVGMLFVGNRQSVIGNP